jgi:cyclopropane fatty-acyl-phospholipid synthase-like methyltransferase
MASHGVSKAATPLPLDLARTTYSYIERPNSTLISLVAKHVASRTPNARIVDVGCGCAGNARALRAQYPGLHVTGVEPNARAAELARGACDAVVHGTMDDWLKQAAPGARFDAIVLADVVEHIADPVDFLRSLVRLDALGGATWIISIPNYAVWHNRIATLLGLQAYQWNGLWDRTHLRFFTRSTARKLLEYCGLEVVDEACTASFTQAATPALRKLWERDLQRGDHLALTDSAAYRVYRDWVEPVETRICSLWPELLGFQMVFVARVAGRASS